MAEWTSCGKGRWQSDRPNLVNIAKNRQAQYDALSGSAAPLETMTPEQSRAELERLVRAHPDKINIEASVVDALEHATRLLLIEDFRVVLGEPRRAILDSVELQVAAALQAEPPNRIRRHRPGFVEGYPDEEEFATVHELVALELVHSWTKLDGFYRFSQSISRDPAQFLLMAEFNGGSRWHVVGYLDRPLPLDQLPKWCDPRAQPASAPNRLPEWR